MKKQLLEYLFERKFYLKEFLNTCRNRKTFESAEDAKVNIAKLALTENNINDIDKCIDIILPE